MLDARPCLRGRLRVDDALGSQLAPVVMVTPPGGGSRCRSTCWCCCCCGGGGGAGGSCICWWRCSGDVVSRTTCALLLVLLPSGSTFTHPADSRKGEGCTGPAVGGGISRQKEPAGGGGGGSWQPGAGTLGEGGSWLVVSGPAAAAAAAGAAAAPRPRDEPWCRGVSTGGGARHGGRVGLAAGLEWALSSASPRTSMLSEGSCAAVGWVRGGRCALWHVPVCVGGTQAGTQAGMRYERCSLDIAHPPRHPPTHPPTHPPGRCRGTCPPSARSAKS